MFVNVAYGGSRCTGGIGARLCGGLGDVSVVGAATSGLHDPISNGRYGEVTDDRYNHENDIGRVAPVGKEVRVCQLFYVTAQHKCLDMGKHGREQIHR